MGASLRQATIDWPQIIAEMRGEGLMLKAIARKVGAAPTTIGNLAQGVTREPCYSVGIKLLELHAQHVRSFA